MIGVYEPVVWLVDGTAQMTSRAALRELSESSRRGEVFHPQCYRGRLGGDEPPSADP